jgi:hypothetical protein
MFTGLMSTMSVHDISCDPDIGKATRTEALVADVQVP